MEWNDRAKRGMTCGIEDARGSNIPVRHSHLGAGVRRSDHPQSVQNGRAEDHRIDREFGPPHPKAAALPHRVALLPLLPFPHTTFAVPYCLLLLLPLLCL